MAEDLQEQILQGYKCKICKNYMKSFIFTCENGHSVCKKCEEISEVCSCTASITKSRNFAMEAVAMKVVFPCMNASSGCREKLLAKECLQHEATCTLNKKYVCELSNCTWKGNYERIFHHWKVKRLHIRPYGDRNICHLRLKNDKMYVNIIHAFDQLFWYIFQSHLGILYWSVQYIGQKKEARNYYYDINFFQHGRAKKRMIFGNYCQAARVSKELDEMVYGVAVPFNVVSCFVKKDLLIFQLNMYKIDEDDNNVIAKEAIGACSLAYQANVPEEKLIDFDNNLDDSALENHSPARHLPPVDAAVVEYRIPAAGSIPDVNANADASINSSSSINSTPNLSPSSNAFEFVNIPAGDVSHSPNGDSCSKLYPSLDGDSYSGANNDLYPKQKCMYVLRDNQYYAVNYPSSSSGSPVANSNQNFTPVAPPRNSRRNTNNNRRNSKTKGKQNDDCVIL